MEKYFRNKIIFIYILSIFTTLSCNKSVYLYSDHDGSSKFVIYKNIFEYFEKKKGNLRFKTWGDYSLTDSTIVFEFRDENLIPYNYFGNNIEETSSNSELNHITVTVINRPNNNPMGFVTIKFKDKFSKLLYGTMTDKNGIAKIVKDEKIQYIEIQCLGYFKLEFNLKKYINQNLTIKLDELKPGGRMQGNCLLEYIDVLVKYEIDDPYNMNSFKHNGIVYKKRVKSK